MYVYVSIKTFFFLILIFGCYFIQYKYDIQKDTIRKLVLFYCNFKRSNVECLCFTKIKLLFNFVFSWIVNLIASSIFLVPESNTHDPTNLK